MKPAFTHVVLSGASIKCLTALGCLRFHEMHGHLENVHTFVGVSAGAILGLLLAVGYDTSEILNIVYNQILPCTAAGIQLEAVLELAETLGLSSGDDYVEILARAVSSKLDGATDLTFAQLKEATGRSLVVGVTNVNTHVFECWDANSHPDTSVLLGVRASMSIPLLFTPVRHNNQMYVDGAVLNSFPIEKVPVDALPYTLAINIVNRSLGLEHASCKHWTFMEYLRELLATATMGSRQNPNIACHTLLTIPVEEPTESSLFCFAMDKMRFAVTPTMARQYVQQGFAVAKCAFESSELSMKSRT